MLGGAFEKLHVYKRACSKGGYRATQEGPLMSEVEAISENCEKISGAITSRELDMLLARGSKVITTSSARRLTSIYNVDGEIQPRNACIGKEYIIEGKQITLKTFFDAISDRYQ